MFSTMRSPTVPITPQSVVARLRLPLLSSGSDGLVIWPRSSSRSSWLDPLPSTSVAALLAAAVVVPAWPRFKLRRGSRWYHPLNVLACHGPTVGSKFYSASFRHVRVTSSLRNFVDDWYWPCMDCGWMNYTT